MTKDADAISVRYWMIDEPLANPAAPNQISSTWRDDDYECASASGTVQYVTSLLSLQTLLDPILLPGG